MAALSAHQCQQIVAHLQSKSLNPTQAWLAEFVATQKPSTPLPAVKQTALFRLLASDITLSLDSNAASVFPADVLDADIKQRTLSGPLPVQILGIEDVGRSKSSQVEKLEAAAAGETTKGREIVRVVPSEGIGSDSQTNPESKGPFKVLLQDSNGLRVYGFDVRSVEGLSMNTSIGCKLMLHNVAVARGVVLLESKTTILLGGKIDALHKAWRDNLKQSLSHALSTQDL